MTEEIQNTPDIDPKAFWKSKTFWGLVVVVLSRFLTIEDQPGFTNDLFTLAGTALAFYGRLKATAPIRFRKNVQPETD